MVVYNCDVEGHQGTWWWERFSMGKGIQGSRAGRNTAWTGTSTKRKKSELMSIGHGHLEYQCADLSGCLVSVSHGNTIPWYRHRGQASLPCMSYLKMIKLLQLPGHMSFTIPCGSWVDAVIQGHGGRQKWWSCDCFLCVNPVCRTKRIRLALRLCSFALLLVWSRLFGHAQWTRCDLYPERWRNPIWVRDLREEIKMLLSRDIKKNTIKKTQTHWSKSTAQAEGCTRHTWQWQTHTLIVVASNPQGGGSQASVYLPDSWAGTT